MFPTFWVTVSSFGGLFFSVWIQGSNIRLAKTVWTSYRSHLWEAGCAGGESWRALKWSKLSRNCWWGTLRKISVSCPWGHKESRNSSHPSRGTWTIPDRRNKYWPSWNPTCFSALQTSILSILRWGKETGKPYDLTLPSHRTGCNTFWMFSKNKDPYGFL